MEVENKLGNALGFDWDVDEPGKERAGGVGFAVLALNSPPSPLLVLAGCDVPKGALEEVLRPRPEKRPEDGAADEVGAAPNSGLKGVDEVEVAGALDEGWLLPPRLPKSDIADVMRWC